MSKVISIISGKGGVGKTTTSLNLGIAFSEAKLNTVVIEGNITTPNIGLHLGTSSVPVTLNDVLKLKNKFHEAIYEHPSGMKLIPASLNLDEVLNVDLHKFPELIQKLKNQYEIIIIDGAPGIGKEAINVLENSDFVIIVATPDIISITEAHKNIKLCELKNKKILGIVLTRFKNKTKDLTLDDVENLLKEKVLGVIPEDDTVRKALHMKHPVSYSHPRSPASKNYKIVAEKILGKHQAKELEKEKGLYYYVLKKLGFKQ